MTSKNQKGFTVVEMLLVASLCSVLIILTLQATVSALVAVNSQVRVTETDRVATRALREMTKLLKSAIFPYKPSGTLSGIPGSVGGDSAGNVFVDLDDEDYGFGGNLGQQWKRKLEGDGLDSIVFVVPVDAQEVGNLIDGKGKIQVGVERKGIRYLSCSATGVPGEDSFEVRNATAGELVSAIAVVDPDKMNSDAFEKIAIPSLTDWETFAFDAAAPVPDVTCFMAIRYVPVRVPSTDQPLVVKEQNLFRNTADFDLDGDDDFTGEFHIGKLQLVFSGGSTFYYVDKDPVTGVKSVKTAAVDQEIVDLTPDVVLRKINPGPTDPKSFFKMHNDIPGVENEEGGQALSIRLLLLDASDMDYETGKIAPSPTVKAVTTRRYETSVFLRNMAIR